MQLHPVADKNFAYALSGIFVYVFFFSLSKFYLIETLLFTNICSHFSCGNETDYFRCFRYNQLVVFFSSMLSNYQERIYTFLHVVPLSILKHYSSYWSFVFLHLSFLLMYLLELIEDRGKEKERENEYANCMYIQRVNCSSKMKENESNWLNKYIHACINSQRCSHILRV